MLVLKKGASKEEIAELSKKIGLRTSKKGLDTSKYVGTVKFGGEDALMIQKRMRSEWDR